MRNPITLIRPVLFVVMLASMTSMLQGCIGVALTGAAAKCEMLPCPRAKKAEDDLAALRAAWQEARLHFPCVGDDTVPCVCGLTDGPEDDGVCPMHRSIDTITELLCSRTREVMNETTT